MLSMHFNLLDEGEIPGKILKRWLKETGGIDGKPLGMEVDVLMMDRARVKKLIKNEIKAWLKPKKQTFLKTMSHFDTDDELDDEVTWNFDENWERFQ